MRKILITVAAGFVGRHFTQRFLDMGEDVSVMDKDTNHSGLIKNSGNSEKHGIIPENRHSFRKIENE